VSPLDLLHRAGAAQQVKPFFPWLPQQTGAKRFYMPSADYIWPQTMNR
jgi:branched-chain amino acid transport system substrate-binding protein